MMDQKKPTTVTVQLRMEVDVKEAIQRIADEEDRTFAVQAGRALREWLATRERGK